MKDFTTPLLKWYSENKRALPWRTDPTPYRVWVSEIMLQQTRIEAARGYFERFMQALPTVEALAAADEDTVLKLWEGLGYYSRARNLHAAAKLIVSERNGEFPRSYDELRRLPGVGEYTAGAIASIAFGERESAVDGNVLRVIARLQCSTRSTGETAWRREVRELLRERMPADAAGDFTSALMELGEVVCTPGMPDCGKCPLQGLCGAHAAGEETRYPVVPEKKPRRIEKRDILLFLCGNTVAVQKRPDRGLLAGLWEYPSGEVPQNAESCGTAVHIFSHVEWHMTGWIVRVGEPFGPYTWVTQAERRALAIPTAFKFWSKLLDIKGF